MPCFTLKADKKYERAVKEMFRANAKMFNVMSVFRHEKYLEVHFYPRSVFYMEKIDDIFRNEKKFGTEFSVRWGVDPL